MESVKHRLRNRHTVTPAASSHPSAAVVSVAYRDFVVAWARNHTKSTLLAETGMNSHFRA